MNLRKVINQAKENGTAYYSLQIMDCSDFEWAKMPLLEKHAKVITDEILKDYIFDNADLLYSENYCLSVTKEKHGWSLNVCETEFDASPSLSPRQNNLYNEEEA